MILLFAQFSPIVSNLAVSIVAEKEKKLLIAMQTIGLHVSASLLAWAAVYGLVVTIAVIVVTVLVRLGQLFPLTDILIVYLLLQAYAFALIAFGFVVSAVVNQSKPAGLVASLGSIIFALPLYLITSLSPPLWAQYLIGLSAPASLATAMTNVIASESNGVGVQFSSLFVPHSPHSLSVGGALIMLLVDTLVYTLLAIYLEAVWPWREFGVAQPLCFCFGCGRNRNGDSNVDMDVLSAAALPTVDNARAARIEPTEYEQSDVSVRVRGLTKQYTTDKTAVNRVSLDVLNGEVFALLGHNGAGVSCIFLVFSSCVFL